MRRPPGTPGGILSRQHSEALARQRSRDRLREQLRPEAARLLVIKEQVALVKQA